MDINILMQNNDRMNLMLINFEWVGVEDVMQYPSYMSYTNMKRSINARDRLSIKAVHNLAMEESITLV